MNFKASAISLLAFATTVATILALGRHKTPDVWEYDTIAVNMLQGNGYLIGWLNTDYRSLGYPLYPVFCAAILYLTRHSYVAIELAQAVMVALTCYLVYMIATKVFDERSALFASFLTALHPGLIVYATRIHELTCVVFFITLLAMLMCVCDREKISSAALVGFITGLGILLRPTLLLFLPAYGLYIYLASRSARKGVVACLVASAVAGLVILPWTVRNYNVHKRFIFITTSSAEHFWRGNNQHSTGTALTPDNRGMIEVAPKEFTAKLFALDEMGQYDLFYKETRGFIASHPTFFAKLVAKKIFYFWWFSPQTGLWYPPLWTSVYKVYYAAVLLFFVGGSYHALSRLRGEKRSYIIALFAFFALVSICHGLYYVEIRHRWAIEPLMLMLASYGLVCLLPAPKRLASVEFADSVSQRLRRLG